MKRFLRYVLAGAAAALGFGNDSPVSAATDSEVEAQASALQVAGAFSNDGFKIRDGHWFSVTAPKQIKAIQVNLFAGNQYWFIAAGATASKRLSLTVYDETGKPVATEPYENARQAAAGFAPQISGPYYIREEEAEGPPATFCFLYSYK